MHNIFKVQWLHLQALVENLAIQIQQSGKKYEYIVGVPRGGLIPAVMLSHILNVEVISDSDFYEAAQSQKQKCLIVDDIADSGSTLKRFPKDIDTATVYCKIGLEKKPTYYAMDALQEEWIMFPYEKNINDSVSSVNYNLYHNEKTIKEKA